MEVEILKPKGYEPWYYRSIQARETEVYVRRRFALEHLAPTVSYFVYGSKLYIGLVAVEFEPDGTPVYLIPTPTSSGVVALKTVSGKTVFLDGECVVDSEDLLSCEQYGYAVLCDSDNVCVPLAGLNPLVILSIAGILGGTLALYKYFDWQKEEARTRVVQSLEKLYGKLEEYCKLNPYDCVKAHQALTSLLTQFRAELEEDPLEWLRRHWKELLVVMVSIASILLLIIKFNVIRAILDVIRGRRR